MKFNSAGQPNLHARIVHPRSLGGAKGAGQVMLPEGLRLIGHLNLPLD
jgi:hypothetical protein